MALVIIVALVTLIGCITKWIWKLVKHPSQNDRVLANTPSVTTGTKSERRAISEGVATSVAAGLVSSSSSPSSSPWKYDVFLSFKGDTRKGITVEIYNRLDSRGIKTFMDERAIEVGDVITPVLLAAIKDSRFAIVVLSQNYASSSWCLEELRVICLSMETNRILPLFYQVDPTDVRYQKNSFENALYKHETSGRHESEKIHQWRHALTKVASISGWNLNNYKSERELVNVIVEDLSRKVVPDAIEATVDFQEFEATIKAMDKVMKALIDDEVTSIGVYGMGGVGKTTMIKHVAEQSYKNGTFHQTILIRATEVNLQKIQKTLADGLGIRLQEKTDAGRAIKLHKEIMRAEKILIILDDVWERTDLSKIGIPSYNKLQKCKSKLILTTRKPSVCHLMHCQEKICLSTLSEEDSWTLFLANAKRGTLSSENTTFEEVARRVAAECKCLPVALVAVARALGDKDLVEWNKASLRLKNSQYVNPNHAEDKENAFKCIRLSYNYLKKEEYKSYFLLCCLFPEGEEIEREVLFRYAIGKGLFRDDETLFEARGTADTVVKHLIDSSLLLEGHDGDDRYVMMHDVVRDTALDIAKSKDGHRFFVKYCASDSWPRQSHEGWNAVSRMENDIRELPLQWACPKLHILSLNYNYCLQKIPGSFLESLNELRVLDLSWTAILKLPRSFGLLTSLQALYLDDCKTLIDISMVGKLITLEVLSLRYTHVHEFPREIGNLTNLRLLDMTGGNIMRIPSKIISRLHSLEELYLECGFWDWGSNVDVEGDETNACFNEVTGLPRLRVLHVWISNEKCIPKRVQLNLNSEWIEFNIYIGKKKVVEPSVNQKGHANRTIFLKFVSISKLPDWFFIKVMNNAKKLLWEQCPRNCLIDVFMEYEHGKLRGLKHLSLFGVFDDFKLKRQKSTRVPEEPNCPVFENLDKLHLWRMEFCAVKLPPGSLFNLKKLDLKYCYNSGSILFPSSMLQGLENLEELKCDSMDEIEYVFGNEVLLRSEPSNLRKITLHDLPEVRGICEGPAPPEMFQNLHSLSIINCALEGNLFTSDVAQCLSLLRILELKGCPLLERIVEANNKRVILPTLKQLSLTELPLFKYESATFNIECPLLEELSLWDCPKFSVFVPADFQSTKQVQVHDKSESTSDQPHETRVSTSDQHHETRESTSDSLSGERGESQKWDKLPEWNKQDKLVRLTSRQIQTRGKSGPRRRSQTRGKNGKEPRKPRARSVKRVAELNNMEKWDDGDESETANSNKSEEW